MRYGLLADIHGNWLALQSVLADAAAQGITDYWCLGDVVGYGPRPVECLQFLRDRVADSHWVLGNHDAALMGLVNSAQGFNPFAREAIEIHQQILRDHRTLVQWTSAALSEERSQPRVEQHGDAHYVFVHACLNPLEYVGLSQPSYLYPWSVQNMRWYGFDALLQNYRSLDGRAYLCFGHTHFPTLSGPLDPDNPSRRYRVYPIVYGEPTPLAPSVMLINPGSVGQPRDGDTRAAYAILDTEQHTVEFRRVTYPVEEVQTQIEQIAYSDKTSNYLRSFLANGGGDPDHQMLATVYTRTEHGLEPCA